MINNHLQPLYDHLQLFNKHCQTIITQLQRSTNNYKPFTTIYNSITTDLQWMYKLQPFTTHLVQLIYKGTHLQSIYNESFTTHLQSLTIIYNPFTIIDNHLQTIEND